MTVADDPLLAEGDPWLGFMNWPADYAEPGRLAACFGGAISEEACERMLRTERLRSRLSNLLTGHYRLDAFDRDPGEADRTIALAPAERLERIALAAGAIYWSDSFAASILAADAAVLQEHIGEDLYVFALANRALAGPLQALDPLETVRQRVFSDGWRCVGAWCHSVPAPIGDRVRLKLPPDELIDLPPAAEIAGTGAEIVRRAATFG